MLAVSWGEVTDGHIDVKDYVSKRYPKSDAAEEAQGITI